MLSGSCRCAQSAPTTDSTSGLCRCRRITSRWISSSTSSPPGGIAEGSSSRISSANESALPLCGVAEARMSASHVCGQQPGQPVVLGGRVGEVVRLVDDDGVPPLLAQARVVAVGLQRVDRDDHALEVGERVAGGRQLLPDPLDAGRVQPHERQREPRPHLVLHLLQHVPRRDDEDALAPAPPDQLGEDHADLEGLAEPDGVGQQDAGAAGSPGPAPGGPLSAGSSTRPPGRRSTSSAPVSPSGTGVLRNRRLQPEPRGAVTRAVVGDDRRRRRVQWHDRRRGSA